MTRAIWLSLLIAVTPVSACAADFPAKVIGISDGDTLTVLKNGREQVRIRLHGIDAPESAQDYGSRAKQSASDLAFGKDMTVRPRGTDRYGRTVADLILPDGTLLNQELVRLGMAWWYRQHAPDDRELARLEGEARGARRGLWSQPQPIPPWEWRNGPAAPAEGVVGNRRSHLYHSPHCRGVAVMKPENRITFKTAREAQAAGYKKAGDCP
jgi:endonuclease YncB( thermonuclease family)